MVIANPDNFACNCRLYAMQPNQSYDTAAFTAILNSTLVALWRNFYGRYTGTEGALETMVIDARMMEVPSPESIPEPLRAKLTDAFSLMSRRPTGDLVEEQLMECHTPDRAARLAAGPLVFSNELRQADRRRLDDAVFELLGVSDQSERGTLIARLYEATAKHFRDIRVVEIKKMEQRARSENRHFNIYDRAADIWDAAELDDATPLAEWMDKQPESSVPANIPVERPAVLMHNPLFNENAVFFRKVAEVAHKVRLSRAGRIACAHLKPRRHRPSKGSRHARIMHRLVFPD